MLVRSLASQLGLDAGAAADTALPESSAALVGELLGLEHEPLIAVDALDEALRAEDVLAKLILPVIRARRSDDRPVARILAGCRSGPEWPRFDPLLAAVHADQLVDLGRTPPDILRRDLTEYVDDLPRTRAPYDSAELADTRRRSASGVAE